MQVKDALACVFAVVDDEPIISKSLLFGNLRGLDHQVAQKIFVHQSNVRESIDLSCFGNQDDVRWRLWRNVVEGKTEIVLKHNLGGNFFFDNFFKNGAHGKTYPMLFKCTSGFPSGISRIVKQQHLGLKQAAKHKGHGFVRSLFYGPVRSRRYGLSFGINLSPVDRKACSFNCIYCQLGWNPKDKKKNSFPSTQKIIVELKKQLPDLINQKIDTIALSGNGEPTLHPGFDKIVAALLAIRKKHRHKPRLVCLTNGTTLCDKKIRRALMRVDECCLKIDAGSRRVNLPAKSYDQQDVVRRAKRLKNLVAQSCFFNGRAKNVDAVSVRRWIALVVQLKPQRVDIYTISRRTPAKGLRAVSTQELRAIATQLRLRLSVNVRVCL